MRILLYIEAFEELVASGPFMHQYVFLFFIPFFFFLVTLFTSFFHGWASNHNNFRVFQVFCILLVKILLNAFGPNVITLSIPKYVCLFSRYNLVYAVLVNVRRRKFLINYIPNFVKNLQVNTSLYFSQLLSFNLIFIKLWHFVTGSRTEKWRLD